jgi:hypothetical protein
MLGRALFITASVIGSLAANADAQAQRAPATPKEHVEIERSPLLFYLAKGEPNACGAGCSEWIAAEGQFDSGAAERFRNFLKQLSGRTLPIYFYSPGGLTDNGLAIGRMLRERGMTAGVARTIPEGCIGKSAATCHALKRSGATLVARWRGINAGCNSSCVYALIGAKVRHVPPGARVGIHTSKVPYIGEWERLFANAQLASFNLELHNYIHEMGINDDLYGAIQRVPFEKVHILSRNELARLRIDTSSFEETPWTVVEASPTQRASVIKLFTHANGTRQDDFRTSLVRLSCGDVQQINVRYERELALDKSAARKAGTTTWAAISLVAGPIGLSFPRKSPVSKVELVDAGRSTDGRTVSASVKFLEAAAGHPTIDILETDSAAELAEAPRIFKLSTLGLSTALGALRESCGTHPPVGRYVPSSHPKPALRF